MKNAILMILTTILITLLSSSGLAQEAEQLKKELQEMKQTYETKIADLEKRLAAIEQQQITNKNTVSTVQLAAEKAARTAVQDLETGQQSKAELAQQIGTTPTYDQLRDAESQIKKLETQMKAFEFHGYFRSGYGLNGTGAKHVGAIARLVQWNILIPKILSRSIPGGVRVVIKRAAAESIEVVIAALEWPKFW